MVQPFFEGFQKQIVLENTVYMIGRNFQSQSQAASCSSKPCKKRIAVKLRTRGP